MPASRIDAAAVLDALRAGVLVLDESGIVALANEGAARILARPREGLAGTPVHRLIAPLERLLRAPSEDTRRAADRPEIRIALPDGKWTEVGFSVTPFAQPDGTGGFVLLFQELTAVLQLRQERDRLLQFAAVGEALPSVLHELRNPLAAVTALLELLVEDVGEPHTTQVQTILSEVRRLTLSLQGVGGLVRPARAEKIAAIDEAVRDACQVLAAFAESRGITLVSVGPDLPRLPLDRDVVRGVVFNLVKNAIDASGPGQRIEVDARLESPEVFALGVTDFGHGMTPEVRDRCTDLFFTNKEQGSGIGLALCRRVAEVAGGRLDIDSGPGRGTCIVLRLPLTPKTSFGPNSRLPPPTPPARK